MRSGKKFTEKAGRFKELVLYISQKCATDPHFDTIKLNKLMFFSDFLSYALSGEPITGFEYLKLERGPAPRRMPEMKKEMQDEGILGLQELPLHQWKRSVNLRPPDLSVFSGIEISLIDNLIDIMKDADGDTVSEVSHTMPCWIIPALGETIPYEMVFISNEQLTPSDIERGKLIAEEMGLLEQTA